MVQLISILSKHTRAQNSERKRAQGRKKKKKKAKIEAITRDFQTFPFFLSVISIAEGEKPTVGTEQRVKCDSVERAAEKEKIPFQFYGSK